MLEYLFSLSLLIAAVIIVRALCKKKVSGKLVYALWLAVILRLIIPGNLISLDLPFPETSELGSAFLEKLDASYNEDTSAPSFEISSDSAVNQQSNNVPSDAMTSTQASPAPIVDNAISDGETTLKSPIKLDIATVLLTVWTSGSLIALLLFAIPFSITGIRLRKSRKYHSQSGSTKIYVTDKVSSPCVMGIVPIIYITPFAEQCADLHLIILHEKTHIRHADHIWAILRIALIIIFWWNPLIWAAALLSKRDAEIACDESVVRTMDLEKRIAYGRLIVDMIPQKGGFVVAFTNKPIKYRLLRLTGKFKTTIIAAVISVVTISLCFLLAFISNGVDDGENTLIHIHRFNEEATCTTSARCACGDVKGKPKGHSWNDADCENPKTCTRCNLTDGIPLAHSWGDEKNGIKACSYCDATMGEYHEHNWIDATCTADEYCSLCRETRESALGHSFTDATCTAQKTCSRCNYSEGELLDHSFEEATCTTPATCTSCGATEGESLGHDFKNGICTLCKIKDDDSVKKVEKARKILNDEVYGISKSSYISSLSEKGFSKAEIEYVINVIDPDWNAQAEKSAAACITTYGIHTSNGIYYSHETVIEKLTSKGFTNKEAEHGYSYISKKSPSAPAPAASVPSASTSVSKGCNGDPSKHVYEDKKCIYCGTVNNTLTEKAEAARAILDSKTVSPTSFTRLCLEKGYTQPEIDYIIKVISPDWTTEALDAIDYFLTYTYYYTQEDVYNYLVKNGFESSLSAELTKDIKGRTNPWIGL